MNHKYDVIVIGGGQAGPTLAARFAAADKPVAIIERPLFGGTCVNTGCTPTKTLRISRNVSSIWQRCHGDRERASSSIT
jgi:pyruvate/2-oxoglutarate dehydrogenase complex dihydrolipoamide dehydrogenase (E3) component